MSKTTFLGLNYGLHDSSATLLQVESDRVIDYQIFSTERLTKIKHAGGFPFQALRLIKKKLPDLWSHIAASDVAVNSNVEHPKRREEKKKYLKIFHSI